MAGGSSDGVKDLKITFNEVSSQFSRLFLEDVLVVILEDRMFLIIDGVKDVRMTPKSVSKKVPQNPRTHLD